MLTRLLRFVIRRPRIPANKPSKAQAAISTELKEEDTSRYCVGGYHEIRIGDTFKHGTYKIVKKLGYGQYSTVWLAQDSQTRSHVALKILTADSLDEKHPIFKLNILNLITDRWNTHQGSDHILQLLEEFKHDGPHGEHMCLAFEAMGPDLANYGRLFQRTLSLDLTLDIQPRNILVETPDIENIVNNAPPQLMDPEFISDLPNEFYLSSASWSDHHLTEWIQPQMLRSPDVILGVKWDHKVDIWDLGALIWEFVEGKVLFDGTGTPQALYTAEAHLAQMMAVLGEMPPTLLAAGSKTSQYFNSGGKVLVSSPFSPCQLEDFSEYPASTDKEDYLNFLKSMLRLHPEAWPDATTLLKAGWLQG